VAAPTATGDTRRLIGIGLAVAAAYVIAARLGFRLAFVAEQITTVWPPTGIAQAALLLWGRSLWPAIWLGAFVANVGTEAPLWTAAAVATGNTLEAVAAAWILQRLLGFDPTLRRARDAVAFIVVAAVMSTAISATIGVTTLCAAAVQPWNRFSELWSDWWLGDALGALVVAPVIVTAVRAPAVWLRRDRVETCLLVIGAAALSQVVFGQVFRAFGQHPLEYVIFSFVIAAAVRLGQPATALVVLAASGVTIWHTVRGAGPFASPGVHQNLILLQAYMGVLAFTGLLLAAAIAERRTSERSRAAAYAVGEVLTDAPSLPDAAPAILRAICENLEWRVSALWLVDRDLQRLRCVAVWSDVGAPTTAFAAATKELLLSTGVGLPGRVWATGKAAWIEDVVHDPNFPRAPVARGAGIHGAFAFPICLGEEVLGVIECFNRTVITPDTDLLRTMSTVGSHVGQFMGRKREESAVMEVQKRTRAILETAMDAIIGMDHQGVITEFNPAAEQMFGYRRQEALGRELADLLIPHRLRAKHRGGLARYLATGDGLFIDRRVETTGHHADGFEFPVEVAITRVSDDDPPRFTGFVRDLTERAHAEREREQLLQREQIALREAELQKRFLYSLFMQAPTLIAVLRGPNHIIELANPPMREVWGHTEDELRDRPLFDVMPELQEQVVKPQLDEVYRTGVPYLGRETPSRFDRGNGVVDTVYFNFFYSPFKNVHDEIEGIFVIASDVTDQVRARQQVDQLREQADAANRAKDEFLATLSHELRTPLNAIVGWTRMLLDRTMDERSTRRALDIIDRNAHLQVQLVADILDVSSIISGGLRLDVRPVDLGSVLEAALDAVRPAADAKKIRIRTSLAASAQPIEGDPQRLQQIVWNLLTNAIKFTQSGGSIDVDLLDAGDTGVSLRVQDDGAGIDPAFLPHVFERFRQADGSGSRQTGGLGLGLAIVRELVDLHGGTIRAESQGLGKGSTFTVELPRVDADLARASSGKRRQGMTVYRSQRNQMVSLGGCRALVVDDEEDARELIATILTTAGANVRTASSVREALQQLDLSPPDVLLADIGMPGADGYVLIREVRRREAQTGLRLPAAAITAYAGNFDRERALAAGFDRHLPKPIRPAAIVAAVHSLCSGSDEAS
jgi:PAS domain S-box-containing protein